MCFLYCVTLVGGGIWNEMEYEVLAKGQALGPRRVKSLECWCSVYVVCLLLVWELVGGHVDSNMGCLYCL